MSDIAVKAERGGGYELRKDKELVVYLLENAEIEHEFIDDNTIELENGVVFQFGDTEELAGIDVG